MRRERHGPTRYRSRRCGTWLRGNRRHGSTRLHLSRCCTWSPSAMHSSRSRANRRHLRRPVSPKTWISLDSEHLDTYMDEFFEVNVVKQIEWLQLWV